ncbi:Biopolymer transport protein ExbD/TolR [uncultured Paludibacter sp.]|nr:Biopolymer transport protein ExbD/TolR [uncultured Paludibacter sp.]
MAEIQQKDSGDKGKKGKQKKVHLRVDFTPMVDMNMLLITFFMLATTMSKPQTMQINMPTKDKDVKEEDKNVAKASEAVTLYLGKNDKVYYFEGIPNYEQPNFLKQTDFSPNGLREVLLKKNANVVNKVNELKLKKRSLQISDTAYNRQISELKNGKGTPVVVIKPLDNSTYKDMVNALDEMLITSVGKYAITAVDENDKKMLKNSNVEFEK